MQKLEIIIHKYFLQKNKSKNIMFLVLKKKIQKNWNIIILNMDKNLKILVVKFVKYD